jgi:hypothetical protein
MIPVEVKVGEDVFAAVEPARARDPEAIPRLFELLAERAGRGELVLLTGTPSEHGLAAEGFPGHRWLIGSLIRSVGDDCAVAALDRLNGGPEPREHGVPPLLVSNRATIRYVAACVDQVPRGAIAETPRRRKDFSAFAHLWYSEPEPEVPGHLFMQEMHERQKFHAIGKIIGGLHREGTIWEDAHVDQFAYNSEHFKHNNGWFVYDLYEHVGTLYRPPTPAESASNLLPILSEVRPAHYPWLRMGYVNARGTDGNKVFDLIESGDLTGWRQAMREEDYDRARELVAAHIAADDELSSHARFNALNQAAMAFSRAGRHADAARVYEEVLGRCDEPTSSAYRFARFNWSQARRRAGDLEAARRGLAEVLELEAAQPLSADLEHAATVTLEELRS